MSPSSRFSPREAFIRASVAAALTTLPLAVSCRQVLGIEERKLKVETPDAGGHRSIASTCGSFTQPSDACAKCMDTACCDEANACAGDTTCKAAYRCIQGCKAGDADCATWCLGSYSRPASLAPLTACASSQCAAACSPHACGVLVNGSSTCDACVQMNCCDENLACASDEACVDIDFCSHRCLPAGSLRCSSDCATTFSAGADDSATRSSCISANCTDACSSDNAWSCLDQRPPVLKPPTLDPITFNMTVVEFLSEMPYDQVTVKACSPTDLDCTAPLDTAVTDHGAFALTVPTGANGFDGYIDLSGGTLYPTLYYFLPPVIVGGDRGRLRLPSADTIKLLSGAIKVDLDATRGHLALVPWDCTLSPAPGVSLLIDAAADKDATTYYFENNAPNHSAMQTTADPALGGAVNLPTGLTRVRATVARLGATISQFNFNIRAGTLTAGSIPPSL